MPNRVNGVPAAKRVKYIREEVTPTQDPEKIFYALIIGCFILLVIFLTVVI
jgi:hypothetical protein